jgi:hypothetical protein
VVQAMATLSPKQSPLLAARLAAPAKNNRLLSFHHSSDRLYKSV